MTTFVTVSSPSYDASSLATKLTEKTADGWTVVTIVPTGSEVTAFLSRDDADTPAAAPTDAPSQAAASDPSGSYTMPTSLSAEVVAPAVVAEPAGWGSAPDPAPAPAPAVFEPAPAYQPAPAPAPAPAPVSSVPAGWYADPSGRFELRYWDGSQWSEHVSRGGQQFTDAPTA